MTTTLAWKGNLRGPCGQNTSHGVTQLVRGDSRGKPNAEFKFTARRERDFPLNARSDDLLQLSDLKSLNIFVEGPAPIIKSSLIATAPRSTMPTSPIASPRFGPFEAQVTNCPMFVINESAVMQNEPNQRAILTYEICLT